MEGVVGLIFVGPVPADLGLVWGFKRSQRSQARLRA